MLKVEVDMSELLRALQPPAPAEIISEAKVTSGLSLFRLLDEGRGPVRPVTARALRIPISFGFPAGPGRSGFAGTGSSFIFRMFSRAVPPLHLTDKTVAEIEHAAGVVAVGSLSDLDRSFFASVLNFLGLAGLAHLKSISPGRTGRFREQLSLRQSV